MIESRRNDKEAEEKGEIKESEIPESRNTQRKRKNLIIDRRYKGSGGGGGKEVCAFKLEKGKEEKKEKGVRRRGIAYRETEPWEDGRMSVNTNEGMQRSVYPL